MDTNLKGKIIVFEGGDGSGKGTQARLLGEYLAEQKIPHASLDFPQYDTFYGQIVAQFLRGEFGKLEDVSPYLAALTFALDRFAVKDQILAMLAEGKVIVANRYVTSNIAHQGSKFESASEQATFFTWIEALEYGQHGLPRENIVIYLKVPYSVSARLVSRKKPRTYLNGKSHDIHEADDRYLEKTEACYNILSSRYDNWITIECAKNGIMISKEEIHEMILTELRKRSII